MLNQEKFKIIQRPIHLLVLTLFILSACNGITLTSTPPTATIKPSVTPIYIPVQETTPTSSIPSMLRLWIPPQFDPHADNTAARILRSRFEEFSLRRPGITLDIRIKAQEGPAGLLEALTTANAAAPLSMPDLIALPIPFLEIAALKGLLHPYDGLTRSLEDADWYESPRQHSRVQNSIFGMPFASDALVLVYRPRDINEPPKYFSSTIASRDILAFPAADTQSLFPLSLYLSSGGEIRDEQGNPYLDENVLIEVLTFLDQAQASSSTPHWLSQYQTFDQIWQVFEDEQTSMTINWYSTYMANLLADTSVAIIPSANGVPYTLSTSWVWAITSPDVESLSPSVELVEFLTTNAFLSRWNEAAGYIPPRPASVAMWQDAALKTKTDQIARASRPIPALEDVSTFGPVLMDAVMKVIKDDIAPEIAARQATESLEKP